MAACCGEEAWSGGGIRWIRGAEGSESKRRVGANFQYSS